MVNSSTITAGKKMSFKDSMKVWFELFCQSYFSVLLIALLVSVIISLIFTLFLSNSLWNQFMLGDQYELLYQSVLANPNYEYTEEDQLLISSYTWVRVSLLILSSTFMFLLPIALVMLTLYYVMQKATAKEAFMKESLSVPFVKGRVFGSIFFCLFIPSLITLGLFFYVIPGFLVMIYSFFLFPSYYIDEAEGFKPFKLSIEYVKGNFFMILFACFFGFGIPLLMGNLIARLFPFFGFTQDAFRSWLDPESRNYLMIFIYHFAIYGVQAVFYPILPPLVFVLYTKIKNEKLEEIMRVKKQQAKELGDESEVVTVFLRGGQKKFKCPSCGTELNAGIKKCFQCGKFIKYRIK